MPPIAKMSNRLLTMAFLAALCIPALGMVLGIGTNTAPWFVANTPFPGRPRSLFGLIELPNKFRRYMNVHFAFRVPLMEIYAQLKVKLFGVSSSDTVVLGKDGWLFYTGESLAEDYRCNRPFTEEELARWTRRLVARRDWLKAHGIPYVFVVAPNPGTIYPENLPESLHRLGPTSRFEQLTAYLAAHSDFRPVDVRAALTDGKKRARLYYKTDTHWNQMGAFIAYEQMSARLAGVLPAWKTRTLGDFDEVPTADWAGDLSYMLGAPSIFRETRVDLTPRGGTDVLANGVPLSMNESPEAWYMRPVSIRESPTGEISRAVVLRDSYFAAPAQFLSSHFRRMVMLWTHDFDPKVIDRERPDVVIEEIVERGLMAPLADDPPLP
ncbi:MAG: alginate O-acetyltransferase complex protein AlgJ [Myxococcales bacterium]|jgi:hypothetical protein|nr:alginate O-acetyltransferase complex protein AlgJ [Myxococcales bacterium]